MAIEVTQGDITQIPVDAIVNAANEGLKGGGGVDGAIHRAGGPDIMKECRQIGHCPTGEAAMTTAGELPAKKVIHTVGPVWKDGNKNEEELLANAYRNSMKVADENDLMSISFPNISTGIYGFPKDKAAQIAIKTVKSFLNNSRRDFDVKFVCFDNENLEIYQKILNEK